MQSTLNKLLKVGKPIEVPAPPPFSGVSSDAHTWSIPMTSRYIAEVLELPQCAEQFKRFELNGLSLISMDEDHVGPIKFEHSLHCKKLVSHAQQLREKVLEKASIQCPSAVYEWSTAHVAAWLTYKQACPNVGMHALRNNVDGRQILDATDGIEFNKLTGDTGKESEKATKALKQLINQNAHKNHPPPPEAAADPTDSEEFKTPKAPTTKKSKSKTAIARRRASEKLSLAMNDDDEEEDEPELIVIPSAHHTTACSNENNSVQKTNRKKKGQKGSPPHDSDDTNRHIMDTLQDRQQAPSATTDLPLPDSYSSGHERKKFLDKISSLHQTVEQHTVSMNQLHAYAAKLQQENEYFQAEQRQLFLENSASKQVIANLVADRNAAVGELEKVVGLYQTQIRREQELLKNDIHRLMGAKDQLAHENNTLELNNALSRTAVANSSTGLNSEEIVMQPFTQPVRDDTQVGNNAAGSIKKLNLNRTAPAALQPSVINRISAVDDEDSDLDGTQTAGKTTSSAPSAIPFVGLSATMPVAVSSSSGGSGGDSTLSSHSPLKVASQSLSTPIPAVIAATSTDDKHPSPIAPQTQSLIKEISLLAMAEDSAQSERDIWQRLIATYSYPKSTHSSVAHVEDTRTLMGKMSVLWVRLGLRMLRDAHSSETETGLRKALLGLEKCARKSIVSSKPMSTTSNGKPNNDSPLRKNSTLTTKSTKSSSLFRSSNSAHSADTLPSQCSSGGLNEYCVAVGVVFDMALAQRILNRYSGSDEKTNLLYLLNKMNHGELPMTELSRDNLRDFLGVNLGMNLKWDRFDSICQRVDIEKKGFVSTWSVLRAFQNVTPLVDKTQSAPQAVFVNLMTLTIAILGLTERKQDITGSFLSVISENTDTSPSFVKFMSRESDSFSASKFARLAGTTGLAASRPSSSAVTDVKILEEQLFVSDVLFELSRGLLGEMEMSANIDWRAVGNAKKQSLLEHHALSLSSNPQYFAHVTFLLSRHQEACSSLGKGLQIYEGAEREMLNSLCTLFVSFLTFRRACLKHMLDKLKTSAVGVSETGSPTRSSVAPSLLDKPTLKTLIADIEAALHRLLDGEEEGAHQHSAVGGILANCDSLSLAQHEAAMCELLGMPVPCGCACGVNTEQSAGTKTRTLSHVCGLVHNQCLVEVAVHRTRSFIALANEVLGQERQTVNKPLATSSVLREIQQELHESLWGESAPGGVMSSGEKKQNKISKLKAMRLSGGGGGDVFTDGDNDAGDTNEDRLEDSVHVVEEVNALMHKQRVEQTSRYLELLNAKAARKKKIIQALVSLWTSTKIAVGHKSTLTSFSATAESVQHNRLYAMPVSDILSQTRQVQNVLLNDMQRDGSTKNAQLSERIGMLRKGMQSASIGDPDGAISSALGEIGALEGSLLQANSDAMRLAARIIDQLEK